MDKLKNETCDCCGNGCHVIIERERQLNDKLRVIEYVCSFCYINELVNRKYDKKKKQ